LRYEAFEERLENLTRRGDTNFIASPFGILLIFGFSGRPFYGTFGAGEFRLTRNKVLPFPRIHEIQGTYERHNDNTILNFEIRPIPFAYYWSRVWFVFGFILVNSFLFLNDTPVDWHLSLTLNGFLLFMLAWGVLLSGLQKKRLRQVFIEEFELVK
jgi:hypothetical protein